MPTLVVTRPQPDADLWVTKLSDQGVCAFALPLLRIGPSHNADAAAALQTALQRLTSYDALMFVSANAVHYFFTLLRLEQRKPPAHSQYWSPGPGTTQALLREGVAQHRIVQPAKNAPQFDSESLWLQIQPGIQAVQRVLIIRGGDGSSPTGQGRQWLTQQLQQVNIDVDFASVYERHAPSPTPALLSTIAQLHNQKAVWLFSSSECVNNLRQCAPALTWQTHTALATHPRIAQHVLHAGFGHVIQTQPSTQAVVASVKSLYDHT